MPPRRGPRGLRGRPGPPGPPGGGGDGNGGGGAAADLFQWEQISANEHSWLVGGPNHLPTAAVPPWATNVLYTFAAEAETSSSGAEFHFIIQGAGSGWLSPVYRLPSGQGGYGWFSWAMGAPADSDGGDPWLSVYVTEQTGFYYASFHCLWLSGSVTGAAMSVAAARKRDQARAKAFPEAAVARQKAMSK